MTANEINKKALDLTRQQTTEQLIEAFQLSDAKLDEIRAAGTGTVGIDAQTTQPAIDMDAFEDVVTARGWIMAILEERGQLYRIMPIGVDSRVRYEDMANPLREGWISGDLGDSWAIRWDEDVFVSNLHELNGIRFHETVTKHMLARGTERRIANPNSGGWSVCD